MKKIKNPLFYLNFGFYSVSATLKWVRHGEKEDRTGLIQVGAGQCKLEFVSRSWERSMTQFVFLLSEHFICSRKRGEKGTALGQHGGTVNKVLSVILQTLVQKASPFLQL